MKFKTDSILIFSDDGDYLGSVGYDVDEDEVWIALDGDEHLFSIKEFVTIVAQARELEAACVKCINKGD